ncbi:hypothetical protein V6N13_108704 [Hibiscus sabdariffa]
MVAENGDWRWNTCEYLLLINILLRIADVKPSLPLIRSDSPGWKWTKDQSFMVKSTYGARMNFQEFGDNSIWMVITKFKGTTRIKMFLWLLAHERVLTNFERVRHHMAWDDRCEQLILQGGRWDCGWLLAFGAIVWLFRLNRNALVFYPKFIGIDLILGRSRRLVESYNLTTTDPLVAGGGTAIRLREGVRWVPLWRLIIN